MAPLLVALSLAGAAFLIGDAGPLPTPSAVAPIAVHVDTASAHRQNVIRPLHAIGVGIDSDPAGKIPLLYSPARAKLMLGAGLGALSYRLYTELSIQDWHWNPAGRFSDNVHEQGYWTSEARPASRAIVDSFGYVLTHRGSTRDQGDDNGYSRIDDGDPSTYWKSNPYLTRAYTGESDALHPQWAVIDLINPHAVNAIVVAWADPYATRYQIQYWTGGDAILAQASGAWHTFPGGGVRNGNGGRAFLRLAPQPVKARFFRVVMDASSGTCDTHSSGDRRNCMGYAIQDIALGYIAANGAFHDLIRRSSCGGIPADAHCQNRQTTIFVSSNDPWHRATDRIRTGQDQPGLDVIARNPITHGLPVMYPVPLFYSTPANAVAQIRYLRARGYPISYVEMGEEVDGQYAMPEDYAALYVEWARAIHAYDPTLKLGGPVFQGVNRDIKVWRDANGDDSWFRRFLAYLRSHHAMSELAFMSFEHYPFVHGCDQGVALHVDLLREPSLMHDIVETWRADGLPANIPMFVTESNFAADATPVPKQVAGALWMADWIGTALASGVAGINYYQYEAEPLYQSRQCGKWGSYGMFITAPDFRILAKSAQYYAAQMLTRQWLEPGDQPHELYPATTDLTSPHPAVTAYAAHRPDGLWSVMLVNKDNVAHSATIDFKGFPDQGAPVLFAGDVEIATFGSEQYHWSGDSATEIPKPNLGVLVTVVRAQSATTYTLPPESITVLRGKVTYLKLIEVRTP